MRAFISVFDKKTVGGGGVAVACFGTSCFWIIGGCWLMGFWFDESIWSDGSVAAATFANFDFFSAGVGCFTGFDVGWLFLEDLIEFCWLLLICCSICCFIWFFSCCCCYWNSFCWSFNCYSICCCWSDCCCFICLIWFLNCIFWSYNSSFISDISVFICVSISVWDAIILLIIFSIDRNCGWNDGVDVIDFCNGSQKENSSLFCTGASTLVGVADRGGELEIQSSLLGTNQSLPVVEHHFDWQHQCWSVLLLQGLLPLLMFQKPLTCSCGICLNSCGILWASLCCGWAADWSSCCLISIKLHRHVGLVSSAGWFDTPYLLACFNWYLWMIKVFDLGLTGGSLALFSDIIIFVRIYFERVS